MGSGFPDISLLTGVVSPEILNAMRAAAAKLESSGVRHALAGALAVGAYGYPCASKDVGFVVAMKRLLFMTGASSRLTPKFRFESDRLLWIPFPLGRTNRI